MAHNTLKGRVIAPAVFQAPADGILSGNLSTSDAAEVINVPRVSNATNNAILTNVGGDANSIVCESNLTFDGDTLNVVGDITASAGASILGTLHVSSSVAMQVTGAVYFNTAISSSTFYGDGSNLINVKADHVVAEGPRYSIQFHDPTDGDLTGSATFLFESDILKLGGGLKLNRRSITSIYTASATDYYIGVDSSGGTISLRLPDASTLSDGQTYVVKDEGGVAHTNNITIVASGSQTIDGQNSVVLESPYAALQLYCNGSNKYFIC